MIEIMIMYSYIYFFVMEQTIHRNGKIKFWTENLASLKSCYHPKMIIQCQKSCENISQNKYSTWNLFLPFVWVFTHLRSLFVLVKNFKHWIDFHTSHHISSYSVNRNYLSNMCDYLFGLLCMIDTFSIILARCYMRYWFSVND